MSGDSREDKRLDLLMDGTHINPEQSLPRGTQESHKNSTPILNANIILKGLMFPDGSSLSSSGNPSQCSIPQIFSTIFRDCLIIDFDHHMNGPPAEFPPTRTLDNRPLGSQMQADTPELFSQSVATPPTPHGNSALEENIPDNTSENTILLVVLDMNEDAGLNSAPALQKEPIATEPHPEEIQSALLKEELRPLVRTRAQMRMLFNEDSPKKRPVVVEETPRKRKTPIAEAPSDPTQPEQEKPDTTVTSDLVMKAADIDDSDTLSEISTPSSFSKLSDDYLPSSPSQNTTPVDSRYDRSSIIFKEGIYFVPKSCRESIRVYLR